MADGRVKPPNAPSLEISNALARVHKEFVGRGPTNARTTIDGDLVVCLLEGGFTRAEQTLSENDNAVLVTAGRIGLQEAMSQAMVAAVEQVVGRRVLSFMSANDLEQEPPGRGVRPLPPRRKRRRALRRLRLGGRRRPAWRCPSRRRLSFQRTREASARRVRRSWSGSDGRQSAAVRRRKPSYKQASCTEVARAPGPSRYAVGRSPAVTSGRDALTRRDALRGVPADELLRRHRAEPDPVLVEELAARFEPLARSVARRYQSRGEPLDDLIQVARFGLLKAITRFDPDRGFAFATYATPTMVGELKRYFRDNGWALHVPRGVKERAVELAAVSDRLSGRLGRSPSVAELAEALGVSEEETLEAIEAYHARHAAPLEPAPGDDESGPPAPVTLLGAEDERLEQAEYLTDIAQGVEILTDTDRLILELRFGRDLTQSEIAARIGTSQMQVSRLLRAAIEKIRSAISE